MMARVLGHHLQSGGTTACTLPGEERLDKDALQRYT
jgi:hypothetical protein